MQPALPTDTPPAQRTDLLHPPPPAQRTDTPNPPPPAQHTNTVHTPPALQTDTPPAQHTDLLLTPHQHTDTVHPPPPAQRTADHLGLSAESRALRRSNTVFTRGVDPDNLVTVLYSNFLLTPEEYEKASQTAVILITELQVTWDIQVPVWQHVSEDCPSHQERRDKWPRPRPLPEEEGSVGKGRGRERGRGGDKQTKLHLCLHNQSTLLPSQHRYRKTLTTTLLEMVLCT